jgi:carbon monoxide dehydrogenase subunit G
VKVTGTHTLAVPRGVVWEAILDPEVLSHTLPGCEDMAPVGDNQFRGKLKMKVGPVQGLFEGGVELLDLDPPNGYNLKMDGKGAPGFVNGTGSIRLEEADDGGTLLHYDIDARVGGRIAAVGQRLLDSSAKVLTRQGLQGLDKQLEARAAAAAATAGAEAPSQAAFAGRFAAGLAKELWPYLAGGALVVLAAIAISLRACS